MDFALTESEVGIFYSMIINKLQAFLCFCRKFENSAAILRRYMGIFVFLPKIQNGRHFSKNKFFLKIGHSIYLKCTGGRKFR